MIPFAFIAALDAAHLRETLLRTCFDPHTEKALRLYGTVNSELRQKAKAVNYISAYGAGEINQGRIAGQYPLKG